MKRKKDEEEKKKKKNSNADFKRKWKNSVLGVEVQQNFGIYLNKQPK